jgi:CSLREA domain-containing protein
MIRPAAWALALICSSAAVAAHAATFDVDTATDAVDASPGDGTCATGAGVCTLRAAVQEANAIPGADVVDVPAGVYMLSIAGQGEDAAVTGDLDITDDLTLIGAGRGATILDGNGLDRVLDILAMAEVSHLAVRNGDPGPDAYGGGIYCSGIVTLRDLEVTGNTASLSGGGIENDGAVSLIDVTISDNTAVRNAGGLDNANDAVLTNVTLSGNSANRGGGLWNDFDMSLTNVTLSANTAATSGGAIRNNAGLDLTNVTIAANSSPVGSAIESIISLLTMKNVIVGSNGPGEDCTGAGTFQSLGNNLESGHTCSFTATGDLVDTDPLLGPLADNMGPTFTHALLPGSPAIDAGGDCPPPNTDQRGGRRPADGDDDMVAVCDIGAYEFGAVFGCVSAPTFSSVRCRVDELSGDVAAVVPQGRLRDRLDKALTAVAAKVDTAEMAFGEGKKRRLKRKLKRAKRSMKKFGKIIHSHKADDLAPDVRTDFGMRADELKADLKELRKAPAS